MAAELWMPTVFDLSSGYPFTHDARAISVISGTDAFTTVIDTRDKKRCVVCGERGRSVLEHAHIVPRVEDETWEDLRHHGFIPLLAKSVQHEARNGVLLCKNHHGRFEDHEFYIRWVPEFQIFVLINHSRIEYMERFHGRAVNLDPDDPRTPFHGAFLIQEMRVRGRWPLLRDRQIPLPILWQIWVRHSDVDHSQAHHGDGEDKEDDRMGEGNDSTSDNSAMLSPTPTPQSPSDQPTSHDDPNTSKNFMTFTNPFANSVELDTLKRSFAVQPNWKASVMEGESWEGSAVDNIAKYRRHVPILNEDLNVMGNKE
ncbi:hypothetical protein D9615_004426 [Tricholomella constricta]|uniref:HNH nuclease domain-containing protein n=1 Tax=Tricholomella constricta TaxID=117010 RepID=A0A8H5HF56_9AGAR|nr:hypothetical protein D9615_004426 [Tricholomella constricta]